MFILMVHHEKYIQSCIKVDSHADINLFLGSTVLFSQKLKHMLKRDLFVQALLMKWQEKVLLSAKTFSYALYQARVAKEQESPTS